MLNIYLKVCLSIGDTASRIRTVLMSQSNTSWIYATKKYTKTHFWNLYSYFTVI